MTFAITKRRTAAELAGCFEDQGTPRRRVLGGYIDDLAALGKCLMFCGSCLRKFKPAAYGYVMKRDVPKAFGRCDGCAEIGTHHLLLHHKHHDGWNGHV